MSVSPPSHNCALEKRPDRCPAFFIARSPKLDESTGMYRYYDDEGREVMIKKDDVTQIMEC
nr:MULTISPECIES: YgdI/YgdR family lipoprotein [unclassified Aeromonas]